MSELFGWTVKPGQVRLSHISVVVDNPDVKIVDIECNSKYPEFMASTGDDGCEVLLYAGDHTLRWLTPMCAPTVVNFPPGWRPLMESGARYTIRMALYREE